MMVQQTQFDDDLMFVGQPVKKYGEAWFEAMFLALDELHDAVSDRRPGSVLLVNPAEMMGWLQDIIYTAQEALVEIRTKVPGDDVMDARRSG